MKDVLNETMNEEMAFLNKLTLGDIAELSDDAKMLIYFSPGVINVLADRILADLDDIILEGRKQ